MNNTNPIFSLKNFRSFGEDGADFELAPITVLTGCNSAGKSSLVKALDLLSDQLTGLPSIGLSKINKYQPSSTLKTASTELNLGGFTSVINEQAANGNMTISYRMWSSCLQEEVICKRVFRAKNNILNEGRLLVCAIEKLDGTIIYKSSPITHYIYVGNKEEEVEIMEEDDDCLDKIDNNYNNFILACKYVELSEKIPVLNILDENKKDDCQQELTHILEQLGAISPNDYNIDIIHQWIERWDTLFKAHSELEITYLNDRTVVERGEDDKKLFYTIMVNEIVAPWFINKSLHYIDSTTNEIRRIYNVENTDKLSRLLCAMIKSRSYATYQTGSFVNDWLEKFQIGNSLEIVGTEEGLGVKVYLKKNNTQRLLADEGYGMTQLISILLQIELSVELYDNAWEDQLMGIKHIICIEEPEVHLHPKYQSLLADLFAEAYQKYNIRFIIETHSEYLIRKLQVLVADKENALSSNDVSLNYVEKDENGVSRNRQIKIQMDGRLDGSFGKGFYDEAGGLSRQLFMLTD